MIGLKQLNEVIFNLWNIQHNKNCLLIMGNSKCGKSTVCRLLRGDKLKLIEDKSQGYSYFENKDTGNMHTYELPDGRLAIDGITLNDHKFSEQAMLHYMLLSANEIAFVIIMRPDEIEFIDQIILNMVQFIRINTQKYYKSDQLWKIIIQGTYLLFTQVDQQMNDSIEQQLFERLQEAAKNGQNNNQELQIIKQLQKQNRISYLYAKNIENNENQEILAKIKSSATKKILLIDHENMQITYRQILNQLIQKSHFLEQLQNDVKKRFKNTVQVLVKIFNHQTKQQLFSIVNNQKEFQLIFEKEKVENWIYISKKQQFISVPKVRTLREFYQILYNFCENLRSKLPPSILLKFKTVLLVDCLVLSKNHDQNSNVDYYTQEFSQFFIQGGHKNDSVLNTSNKNENKNPNLQQNYSYLLVDKSITIDQTISEFNQQLKQCKTNGKLISFCLQYLQRKDLKDQKVQKLTPVMILCVRWLCHLFSNKKMYVEQLQCYKYSMNYYKFSEVLQKCMRLGVLSGEYSLRLFRQLFKHGQIQLADQVLQFMISMAINLNEYNEYAQIRKTFNADRKKRNNGPYQLHISYEDVEKKLGNQFITTQIVIQDY